MTDWTERLAERDRIVALANAVAGDDDAHDAEVSRLSDIASRIEDDIFAADPGSATALGTQVQLALNLWAEQCPLEPRARVLLEGVAAALILTPIPIYPHQPRRAS